MQPTSAVERLTAVAGNDGPAPGGGKRCLPFRLSLDGCVQVQLLGDEQEIIERSRQGDLAAFYQLYQAYRKPLFVFILRMTGNQQDAEDVLQEVFVKAYRQLKSFEKRSAFSTWLFSIAKNETVSFLRRHARRNGNCVALDGNSGWEKDTRVPLASDPEADVLHRETERVLQQALSALPEIYRTAFVLGVIEELPYEEISEILGCSVSNVKSRVFRARAKLARWLAKHYPEFGRRHPPGVAPSAEREREQA